jgi:hypothetical protein
MGYILEKSAADELFGKLLKKYTLYAPKRFAQIAVDRLYSYALRQSTHRL